MNCGMHFWAFPVVYKWLLLPLCFVIYMGGYEVGRANEILRHLRNDDL